MTKEEAKQAALHWLDEATVSGRTLEGEMTADLRGRMDHLLDGAVAAVCGRFPHHAVYRAACAPPRNLFPDGAALRAVYPPQGMTLSVGHFRSYTLEVQGTVQVRVLQGGTVQTVRSVDSPDCFTRIFGVQTGDTLQMEAVYPFRVRAVGLYPDVYPPDAVPPWQAVYELTMPSDFSALEKVLYSEDGLRFTRFSEYRRVSDGVYAVPQTLAGQLEFHYIRRPARLGAAADGGSVLDVEADAVDLVPLRLAADLLTGMEETAVLSGYLAGLYDERTAEISRRMEPEQDRIESVYAV